MLRHTPAQLSAAPPAQPCAEPPSPAAREALRARLRALRQIPALRSLAQRFSISMRRDGLTISEVVESLRHDPALCVRLLQLANSAAIASREPVSDLPTAVQLLGVSRVRLLSTTLLLQRDTEHFGGEFDWKHLWIHALATALLAERLDAWTGRRAADSLAACAILHDVGKIALSVVEPDAYRDILLAAWRDRHSLPALEAARLGLDHREAGALFGEAVGLPSAVLAAIAHHDSPAFSPHAHQPVVALVGVANQWAKLRGLGFSGDGLVHEQDLWETPAWTAWCQTLPSPPDTDDFAAREPRWIEETKTELKILRG
ncbi:MAG: HDOD domain-containing protein [Opitutaceae bacterium]|nr:HDOD domain-containing protein [Opitutaceae bacterium]